MTFIAYLIVGFITFFFMWKKDEEEIHDRRQRYRSSSKDLVEITLFWKILLFSVFWIVSLPLILLWYLLEKIYNKFINKQQTKNEQ